MQDRDEKSFWVLVKIFLGCGLGVGVITAVMAYVMTAGDQVTQADDAISQALAYIFAMASEAFYWIVDLPLKQSIIATSAPVWGVCVLVAMMRKGLTGRLFGWICVFTLTTGLAVAAMWLCKVSIVDEGRTALWASMLVIMGAVAYLFRSPDA